MKEKYDHVAESGLAMSSPKLQKCLLGYLKWYLEFSAKHAHADDRLFSRSMECAPSNKHLFNITAR